MEKVYESNISFLFWLRVFTWKNEHLHNNPEKSSTTKINKYTASGYSLFTNYSFDTTKNKLDCYGGKDCTKNFCKDLKEHVTK